MSEVIVGKVTGGSVSVDCRRSVERTCELTLVDLDGSIAEALSVGGKELSIERNGTLLGIFGSFSVDSSNDKVVTVSGSDRSERISAATFETPWILGARGAHGWLDSVAAILIDRMPSVSIGFAHSAVPAYVAPAGYTADPITFTGDPWETCRKLARADGFRLYFDANGVVQVSPWADVLTAPVVSFGVDDDAVVSKATVKTSLDGVYNGIAVSYTVGGGGASQTVIVHDDVSNSPTSRAKIGSRTTAYTLPAYATHAEATVAGNALIVEYRGRHLSAAWSQICNTSLGVNQVVDVSSVCDVGAMVRIESITYPLDDTLLMTVNGGDDAGVSMADIANMFKRTVTSIVNNTAYNGDTYSGPGGGGGLYLATVVSREGAYLTIDVNGTHVSVVAYLLSYGPQVGDTVVVGPVG